MSAEEVAHAMYTMAHSHVGNNNILYRIFYYDCMPLEKKFHNPISKRVVDFSKTKECLFRKALFEELKKKRKVALRLGSVKENGQWQIYPAKVKELMKGDISVDDLTENDVYLNIRQKSIDMKIGVDIASLSLKRFVDTIVLFSGDADFVPAAKLARREGVDFILDPMNANVDPQLFEHIDGMKSVIPPNTNNRKKQKQAR
ncbi:MAG: NYN domain-containing protein [Bacteroidales bacterium]|nr:NYN domain-containing protein [Bacteroidales bacterium]